MTGTARGTLVSCSFCVILGIKQTGSYPNTCSAKEALGSVNPDGSPSQLVYGPGETKWPGRRMSPGALGELFRRSISPSPCPCKGGKTICEFKGDPEISKYGDISEKGKVPLLS